jgi:transcription initiation factor TFIIB
MECDNKQTKKKKRTINKSKLWGMFEKEVGNKETIECVYRNTGERDFCDTCNASLAFSDQGFLECTNDKCSIIYKDVLDSSAEWRYYGADDNQSSDPTRCGMPINPLLKESSFGCKVICDGRSTYEMRKIRRYTEWQSMPYKEKSQYDEFQRITTMAHNSGISKFVIDDAVRYHKMISEQKTFRGLNRDGIIAASIYISCRINDNPRTAKEIATMFHLDTTSATKGCKNATSIINSMEVDVINENKTNLGTTNPCDFIDRYCSRLNMNNELTKLCKFIAVRIDKNNLMPENTPHSIASGVIYFVCMNCQLNISKRDIHNISEISEVTINKCFKKLDTMSDKLLPQAIIQKYSK